MAREICIQNSRLIKRPLGIADIIGGTSWKYGTLDDHGRIDTGKIKPDGPLVIYDTSRIGRGIQIIGIESSKEIKLALPLPSTDRDVTLLYEIAEKIADLWKSKHIIVEEDKVSISDIGRYVEYDHNMNLSLRMSAKHSNANGSTYRVQPCIYPSQSGSWKNSRPIITVSAITFTKSRRPMSGCHSL